MRFVEIAAIASIAWAIAGSNAGMHFAVAPATSAYRACLESPAGDSGQCRATFHRDWAIYSGDRLSYAVLVGLVPIPFGWLAGWLYVRQSRRRAREPIAGLALAD
jgi:hypothetical protein